MAGACVRCFPAWRPVRASGPKIGLLFDAPLALVGRLEVLAGFFLRALRVVLGAQRQIILVDRPVALARHIEDLAQIDVRPDLRPLGWSPPTT